MVTTWYNHWSRQRWSYGPWLWTLWRWRSGDQATLLLALIAQHRQSAMPRRADFTISFFRWASVPLRRSEDAFCQLPNPLSSKLLLSSILKLLLSSIHYLFCYLFLSKLSSSPSSHVVVLVAPWTCCRYSVEVDEQSLLEGLLAKHQEEMRSTKHSLRKQGRSRKV